AMHHIEAIGLSKRFVVQSEENAKLGALRRFLRPSLSQITAVDNVSFTVAQGEAVAYLGPNGAGKSTTVKMLCGVLVPSEGEIRVLGMNPWKERAKVVRHLGVVFGQRTQLLWDLAVTESFRFLSVLYGLGRTEYERTLSLLVDLFDIGRLMHRPVRELSLGQRTKVELAASLIHRPLVIILDEPTIGMDLLVKDRIRAALDVVRQEFTASIVLASHDFGDVEALCSRSLLLIDGRLRYDGPLADLRSAASGRRTVEFALRRSIGPRSAAELGLPSSAGIDSTDGRLRVTFFTGQLSTVDVVSAVLSRVDVADITIMGPSLEDALRGIYSRSSPHNA
ncbi:MAG: ATP-binding cassette domain-containing protein, partial [Bacillota bacterium]|nr:ATP-binding cassette domain-containing protein [Bacillota bacterium]